jgi:hypothetical protein
MIRLAHGKSQFVVNLRKLKMFKLLTENVCDFCFH